MKIPIIPSIIDVEASGFDSMSYPIEVGVVNQAGERFCRLILPHEEWTHWDDEAESLHGISREVLQKKGKLAHLVCEELNQFLSNQTVYSDGWVVDQPWLIKLFYSVRMTMSFKISPLEMILDEQQMALWHQTKDQLFAEMSGQRHRASSDAALIQNTYVATQHPVINNQDNSYSV